MAEALTAAMAAHGVPGATLGILADGREEYATFGLADVASGTPVAAETLFQIGSLNKTYTATAAMRLADEGRLDLDAPLRAYLPGLRLADDEVAGRVTARHLLTHTGGWWGDYFSNAGNGEDAVAIYAEVVLPTLVQIAPLGEHFSYNNAGFVLLGRVVEALTGRTYRGAVGGLVLEPLDLARSTFDPAVVRRQAHATGYLGPTGEQAPTDPQFLPRSVDPAGGLWSTAQEQLRYARFHLGDGTAGGRRLLRQETLRLMQTPRVPHRRTGAAADGAELVRGRSGGPAPALPRGRHLRAAHRVLDGPGRRLRLRGPAQRPARRGDRRPAGLRRGRRASTSAPVRRRTAPVPPAAPTPAPPPPPTPEQLAPYAGRYRIPSVTVTVRPQDGGLLLTVEPTLVPGQVGPDVSTLMVPEMLELQARLVGPDLAVITEEGLTLPIPFVRRADGSVGWMSLSTRLIPRVGPA